MLTAALIVLCLLLAVALGVVVLFWRATSLTVADQARVIRHQLERIDGYRAELDALSICVPPAAAAAALTPDAGQDTLSDAWLAYVDSLPTTSPEDLR